MLKILHITFTSPKRWKIYDDDDVVELFSFLKQI